MTSEQVATLAAGAVLAFILRMVYAIVIGQCAPASKPDPTPQIIRTVWA